MRLKFSPSSQPPCYSVPEPAIHPTVPPCQPRRHSHRFFSGFFPSSSPLSRMRFVALHDLSPTRNLRHHPPHGCRPARSEIVASFPTSPLAWIGDICEVEARQRRQVPYPSPAPAAHFVASSPFDPARFEWIRTSGVVPRWRQLPIPPHLLGGGAAVPPEHYLGRLGWTRMQLRCPISAWGGCGRGGSSSTALSSCVRFRGTRCRALPLLPLAWEGRFQSVPAANGGVAVGRRNQPARWPSRAPRQLPLRGPGRTGV
ncbi:hypothetical protein SEVIR_6G107801v4 [Setaria viridis]